MGMANVYQEPSKPRPKWGRARFVRALWAFVWREYLYDDSSDRFNSVYRVIGWRTALVDYHGGSRSLVVPMPKWMWWEHRQIVKSEARLNRL